MKSLDMPSIYNCKPIGTKKAPIVSLATSLRWKDLLLEEEFERNMERKAFTWRVG